METHEPEQHNLILNLYLHRCYTINLILQHNLDCVISSQGYSPKLMNHSASFYLESKNRSSSISKSYTTSLGSICQFHMLSESRQEMLTHISKTYEQNGIIAMLKKNVTNVALKIS